MTDGWEAHTAAQALLSICTIRRCSPEPLQGREP
jgi:hypothetical protein